MAVVPHRECRPAPLDALSSASMVPLELIVDAPGQPRRSLPEVEELATNIEAFGLLQAVALRRVEGRYEIVAGHRRVAAWRVLRERHPHAAEYRSISAIVSRLDDQTAFLALVSAQTHCVGWTAQEEAHALARLLEGGMPQCDAAKLLGRSESWLSRRLTVYRDPTLAEAVLAGGLPPGTAEELVAVRSAPARREMAERAGAEDWTKAQARLQVRHAAVHPLVRDVGRRARSLSKDLRGIDPLVVTGDVLADLERLALVIDQRFPRRSEKSAA